jgi:putative Mn2+ efflux pump MntP
MTYPTQYPLYIFAVSFLALWVAARIGSSFKEIVKERRDDFAAIMTTTFTLLGLIVGFTFSMAVTRYDQRKIFEEAEANAIGTEYARVGLLPDSDRDNARRLLREYVEQRILFYQTQDREQLRRINAVTARVQKDLWDSVQTPASANQTALTALVASGMNDVLNSQGYTLAAWRNRIPMEAWVLMGVIATIDNLMIGVYLRTVRSGILLMVLPAILSIAFLLIADIDSPNGGLIHIRADNLNDVAQSFRS